MLTNIKMPVCSICSKSFSRPDSLKRHNVSVHPDTIHADQSSHSLLDTKMSNKPVQASTTLPPPFVGSDPLNEIASLSDAVKSPAELNVASESTEPVAALTTLPQPLLNSYPPVPTTLKLTNLCFQNHHSLVQRSLGIRLPCL